MNFISLALLNSGLSDHDPHLGGAGGAGTAGVDKRRRGRENAVDRREGSAAVLQVSSPGIQLLSCLEGTILNNTFY